MNLFILPGNSQENKLWAEGIGKALRGDFGVIKILNYRHWERGEEFIDLEYELGQLVNLVSEDEEYVIVAKSAGAFLTTLGVYEKKINPTICVFLGTPIGWAGSINFDVKKYFSDFGVPTLFIQQSEDPITKYSELEMVLNDLRVKNNKLIKVEGNDHSYRDYEVIGNLILEFIKNKTSLAGRS
jgi:hypothetical protein